MLPEKPFPNAIVIMRRGDILQCQNKYLTFFLNYKIFRPWMILINTTTIAISSKICMNPPIVWPLTNPNSQSTTSITKIVHSI
jgi:hypothetical protein